MAWLSWIYLVIAGLLEIAWSAGMKRSDGFTRGGWSAFTIVTALVSFLLLALAMKQLPLGTAYAVWVGIGVAGAFVIGAFWFGEPLSPARVGSVALIVLGIVGLKLSSI